MFLSTRYKKYAFEKSEFYKILKRYLLVLCLPLIILGIINYKASTTFTRKQWEDTYITAIEKVCTNFENQIESLYNFSLMLMNIPDVKKLVFSSEKSYYSPKKNHLLLSDVIKQLSAHSISNGFNNRLFLYLNNHGIIVTPETMYNIDSFLKVPFITFEKMDNETFFKQINIDNNMSFLPTQDIKYINENTKAAVFIQALGVWREHPNATLICLIPNKNLEGLIKKSVEPFDGGVYITDQNGNFISGLNYDNKIKEYIVTEGMTFKKNTKTKISINHKRYLIFNKTSLKNDWNFYYVVPIDKILGAYPIVLFSNTVLIFAVLLVGIIITVITTRETYKPLNDILNIFTSDNSVDKKFINEYDYLRVNVNNILKNKNELKENFEYYKPHLKNYLLSELFEKNKENLKDLKIYLEQFNIIFPYKYFMCLCILKRHHLSQMDRIIDELEESVPIMMKNKDIKVYICSLDGSSDILIANMAHYEQDESLIIKTITKWLEEKYISYKAIGIGRVYESINEIQLSYKEAKEAADFRIIYDENPTIYFKDVEKVEEGYYIYPHEIEEKITSLIKSGNKDKAIFCYKNLLDMNVKGKHYPSPDMLKYLLYDISSLVYKIAGRLNIEWDSCQSTIKDFIDIDSIKDACIIIDNDIIKICEIINNRKENGNKRLMCEIMKYIEDNYNDIAISLESVAEYFNITPSYLCRFFKEQSGCNYLDYLNKKRIEESVDLINLYRTRISIKELAKKVGFTNDTTFRRQFKNYIGVTPVEYRNIANNE
jgi:two-component system response regulator YesN